MQILFFKNRKELERYVEKTGRLGYSAIEEDQECDCGISPGYSIIDAGKERKTMSICLCPFCYDNCEIDKKGGENE